MSLLKEEELRSAPRLGQSEAAPAPAAAKPGRPAELPSAGPSLAPPLSARMLLDLPRGTCERKELQPLVYAALEREDRLGDLSPEARALARQAYYWSLARSVSLRDTLHRVLDAAAAADVEVLPLKGSLLAFAVYPDPAMRPMADVDVGVRPAEAEAVAEKLLLAGYHRHGHGKRRYDLSRSHHLVFTRPKSPLVELHVRLVHELGADGDLAGFFLRALHVPVEGRQVLAPSWEDHAFYIALHAATHGLADSPLWLFDLALLLPRIVHPEAIVAAASERNALAATHFAFALAARYLPALALATRAPSAVTLRAASLRALLGADPLSARPDPLSSLLLRFALTDHAGDIARSLGAKTALRLAERFFEARP